MRCINKRCNKEIGDYRFCPYCGKGQESRGHTPKRANGTGSVYKRKDNKAKPYTASSTLTGERVSLGTFKTKQQALAALAEYEKKYTSIDVGYGLITLQYVYYKFVAPKIEELSPSSQKNYLLAWHRLAPLHKMKIADIKTENIQEVIDVYAREHQQITLEGKPVYIGKNGRKTTENTGVPKIVPPLSKGTIKQMAILLGKIYKEALANDWVIRDYSAYISYGSVKKELPSNMSCFSDEQLAYLFEHINDKPKNGNYVDYIIAMCYLNFRVTEFLTLKPQQFYVSDDDIPYFIAGMKTKAGTDRIVPVHPKILGIVKECLAHGGETVFCDKNNKKPLTYNKFRYYFDKNIKQLGLSSSFTPHSCRRTFSTRFSASGASETDLIALMGHTSIEVDRKHYINQEVKTLYGSLLKMD